MIDIDEIRDAHKEMHDLSKADEVYTFYHDETNNIRKLYLDEGKLNVAEPAVFVLGGVVHSGAPRHLDIQPLRDAMRIQKSADEIKLKHIARGDFLDLLKSNKLTTFLEWVSNSGLIVHYQALDPLYWSLVDIIESIICGLENRPLMGLHLLLKADLTTLLRANLPTTTRILSGYNYPDIAAENRRRFLNDLIDILEHSDDVLPDYNAMMLKGMLQAGRDLPSLEFIEGFTPLRLIESFDVFYLTRIAVFKYSSHILDMEDSIRGNIEEMNPSSNGEPVTHYRFADSVSEPGIQISDIMVGVMGKMHSYFAQSSQGEVREARGSLDVTSLRNADLLGKMIGESHKSNSAFLNHVMSIHDIEKMNLFLPDIANMEE